MADATIRQIKIKTGVVKRITKEKTMYEQEAKDLEAKIQKMKDDGKDEYDIKKAGEVHQESIQMIPDTKKRLRNALDDLIGVLKKESSLKEAKEYGEAEAAINDGEVIMKA